MRKMNFSVKSLQQAHWLVSNIEYFFSQLQAAQQGTDKEGK